MSEIWKDIIEFEGLYQVSNYGNVRRHPDKQSKRKNPKPLDRKLQINRLGYLYADFCKEGKKYKKTVHQLVCAAFIPGFMYGDNVNHIDGDKTNNHLSNLEKCSYSENNTHAHKLGLVRKPGESKYYNVSKVVRKYKDSTYISFKASVRVNGVKVYIKQCKSEEEAAKAVDTYLDSIGDTLHNRNFP